MNTGPGLFRKHELLLRVSNCLEPDYQCSVSNALDGKE